MSNIKIREIIETDRVISHGHTIRIDESRKPKKILEWVLSRRLKQRRPGIIGYRTLLKQCSNKGDV